MNSINIKQQIRNAFRKRLGWIIDLITVTLDPYMIPSYSQEGEDILLRRIFEGKKFGFYVDVGAHHPRRFSNTYLLYKMGWNGINIEPNPFAMSLFAYERKRDINLQYGVARRAAKLMYFQFDDPALNTFNQELAKERQTTTSYRVIATEKIQVHRLDTLLQNNLPSNTEIDFFTIDTEGHDLEVLMSNDWERFRPKCVLVESLRNQLNLKMLNDNETFTFMDQQGYTLFAKTYNTMIFLEAITLSEEKLINI